MLGLNRLPQLYHWVFASEQFKRVTDDRFFISIEAEDPKFGKARALLEKTHPVSIEEVEEDMTEVSTEGMRDNASATFEALTGVSSPLDKNKKKMSSDDSHLDEAKKPAADDEKDEDE